jgi:hypothetical protein
LEDDEFADGEGRVRHVLDVDGGNSKTLAVVADERGTILSLEPPSQR